MLNKHVLVTGASGFCGFHVAMNLAKAGHKITAVVRTPNDRTNVLSKIEGVQIIIGDLAGEVVLPQQIDAVVHTAATSPGEGVNRSDSIMIRDNVVATSRLIDHCRKVKIRFFIYFSSLSVYGDIRDHTVDENTVISDPDIYGVTKYLGELMLAESTSAFQSLIIRLPGVIGPESVRNWLTLTLEKALKGEEILIFNQTAEFNNVIHIEDLSAFILQVLDSQNSGSEVLTVGSEKPLKIHEVVELLIGESASRSTIKDMGYSKKAPFLVSNKKASREYGYVPRAAVDIIRQFAKENVT
jgi:nucleoside-diphosphate-sugar epimerase